MARTPLVAVPSTGKATRTTASRMLCLMRFLIAPVVLCSILCTSLLHNSRQTVFSQHRRSIGKNLKALGATRLRVSRGEVSMNVPGTAVKTLTVQPIKQISGQVGSLLFASLATHSLPVVVLLCFVVLGLPSLTCRVANR